MKKISFMMYSNSQRYWELDFFRGLAIISMVIYHALVDFSYLNGTSFQITGFNYYWQEITAILFLLISGISSTISNFRISRESVFQKSVRRGLVILGWGMIITLITSIFIRKELVIFGILHLLGVSAILLYPLRRFKYLNLGIGTSIILLGNYLSGYRFDFVWLVWLGFMPTGFCSVDYFPVFPWFGYILIGVFLGKLLYPNGESKLPVKNYSENWLITRFCFLGRHSLRIYLLHQPLLLIIIYFLTR